jgi:hypothetical protein
MSQRRNERVFLGDRSGELFFERSPMCIGFLKQSL